MLANMIDQHFNHPSVLICGLAMKTTGPANTRPSIRRQSADFMQEMNELAHTTDPWRFTSLRRCDFARDIPDVYSPSIWGRVV